MKRNKDNWQTSGTPWWLKKKKNKIKSVSWQKMFLNLRTILLIYRKFCVIPEAENDLNAISSRQL